MVRKYSKESGQAGFLESVGFFSFVCMRPSTSFLIAGTISGGTPCWVLDVEGNEDWLSEGVDGVTFVVGSFAQVTAFDELGFSVDKISSAVGGLRPWTPTSEEVLWEN